MVLISHLSALNNFGEMRIAGPIRGSYGRCVADLAEAAFVVLGKACFGSLSGKVPLPPLTLGISELLKVICRAPEVTRPPEPSSDSD